jgi:hypothetical protein
MLRKEGLIAIEKEERQNGGKSNNHYQLKLTAHPTPTTAGTPPRRERGPHPAESRTNNNQKNNNQKNTKKKKQEKEKRAIKNMFDRFWQAYPRKVGKKKAGRKFKQILDGKDHFKEIMSALTEQKQTDQWQRNDGQYIPHPTTWLNQGRWDDDPEAYNHQDDDDETGVEIRTY